MILIKMENSLHRSQRSQSVMSSISMQDSQLQFYDAIEYFTSESESDDNSEESDDNGSGGNNKSIIKAIVPGEYDCDLFNKHVHSRCL